MLLTLFDNKLAGMVGLDTTIDHNGTSPIIRAKHWKDMTINMVLFISNNIYGRGTVARKVTIPKEQLIEMLQEQQSWNYMEKWLKGMGDQVLLLEKDTWADLSSRQTEGMILDCLRLKGVMGVTRLISERMVPAPIIPPELDDSKRPAIGALATTVLLSSTVHNREQLGIRALAMSHHNMLDQVRLRNLQLGASGDQDLVDLRVYQERVQTRSFLYPLCEPIYEFNCIYEALVGIADCIRCEC
jgi:hypothetical protein